MQGGGTLSPPKPFEVDPVLIRGALQQVATR
jgi:hypothetical protein